MRFFSTALVGFLSLAFSTATFAQDSAPASSTNHPGAQLARGPGNDCSSAYYPPQAVRLNEEGAVTLNLHIDATGQVTGVDITGSSGFADLDQAAKDCVVQRWHFAPATQNGKPIASTKQYRVIWKLRGNTSGPRLTTPMEIACADIFTDAKVRWPTYQSATLQFRISINGGAVFPFIAISSGDSLFDAKAVQCITHLKYEAAIIDDAPVEISWSAAVRWSPRTGLAYTDPHRLGAYCPDSDFPQDLWKGDPPEGTVISFHIVEGGATLAAAIERSSGNPALDQAALKCVQAWRNPFASSVATAPDVGGVVRVNWHQGHAFVLDDAWK